MDPLSLVIGAGPLAILGMATLSGFFRGKKALEELRAQNEKLKAKLDRSEVRVEEQRKKGDKLATQLEQAKKEADELKTRSRRLKDEAKKASRLQGDVAQREQDLARILETKDSALRGLQEEILTYKQRNALLAEELRRLKEEKKELEQARETAKREAEQKAAGAEAPPVERPARPDRDEREELERLKTNVRKLRRTMQTMETEARVLKRKVEHNRRAYLVTLMQLDLAQDELCLLKTGKVRRQTRQARQQVPPPREDVECAGEDAEEYPDGPEPDNFEADSEDSAKSLNPAETDPAEVSDFEANAESESDAENELADSSGPEEVAEGGGESEKDA